MASITFKGQPVDTVGELPAVGARAPDFTLTTTDLADVDLSEYPGTRILNIFPSVDTRVCAASVRAFNEKAARRDGVHVLNVSADLPFAHKRFCGAEGIDRAVSLSTFRSDFLDDYGVRMTSGPLAGLASRAVLVIGPDGTVRHAEQVPEIAQEPDYDAALAALP
jgi:thiol peroxidase